MNALADEVLTNNLGYSDSAKKAAYANDNLQKVWDHFDMFGKGYIPVQEVPQFCRMLIGEVEVQNSLQVQLSDNINFGSLERPIDNVVLQYRPTAYQAPWSAKAADTSDHSPSQLRWMVLRAMKERCQYCGIPQVRMTFS